MGSESGVSESLKPPSASALENAVDDGGDVSSSGFFGGIFADLAAASLTAGAVVTPPGPGPVLPSPPAAAVPVFNPWSLFDVTALGHAAAATTSHSVVTAPTDSAEKIKSSDIARSWLGAGLLSSLFEAIVAARTP